MPHLSENSKPLMVRQLSVSNREALLEHTKGFADVCLLRLPACQPEQYDHRLQSIGQIVAEVAAWLGPEATLITIGEAIDLVDIQSRMDSAARYQTWISIKRNTLHNSVNTRSLPRHHFGALIHTRYDSPLRHTKTRIGYTYCPVCDKTTKDYGGKKHTYHEYGTLMSDVWRDITCEFEGDLTIIVERFADLFGIEQYKELRVIDCRSLPIERRPVKPDNIPALGFKNNALPSELTNKLIKGDCLEQLQEIPDNSIDLAFADPPYNLGKDYAGYTDDLAIRHYFEWCDRWIVELARVLKPGRTCVILNIPLWAVRHFLYLETVLNFQSWIVWDALSFPVRLLMPAHYSILCFSKGTPRSLPGLSNDGKEPSAPPLLLANGLLSPLAEGFCLRAQCVARRNARRMNDRGQITDVWWDIHRLKHNTRRVDHPCQLPPQLMYRLISLFTEPDETVLDCFNGAGTTTLAAHLFGRQYIGIEKEVSYHELAMSRHQEIEQGLDPFRKEERPLTAKNSPVPRMPKQKYKVPKKTLQLEVKRVAHQLGHLPTRDELARHGRYPIEYYDQYFASWGEVCAAARTTGMSETRLQTKQGYLFEF